MNFDKIFDEFKSKRILIIGDVMIDAYIKGKVNRISPEAPVPIIDLESREDRLGGAANVAMNIKSLGATPILCSVVGEDNGADRFFKVMLEEGLSTEGLVRDSKRVTSVKTRILANNQQLMRVDEERIEPLNIEQEEQLIEHVSAIMRSGIDAVIFEDYNKGTLTKGVISNITNLANDLGVFTTVDPKFDNFLEYKNVSLFKPNLKELREGLGLQIKFVEDRSSFENAVIELEGKLGNKLTFVTLSEHGVYMKNGNESHYISAHVRSIADVSGAGDTVIAVATLALCSGLAPKQIAEMANLAGGLVCEYRGVVPVDRKKLLSEVKQLM